MSEKRKDNRGRVLHNGEIQRKDGRYQFKYIDANGKGKFVYSWRLDHNDATPQGKVRTLSLREMECQIQTDLFDNIVSNGGNMTVLELVEKYISTKTGVRPTTKAGYKTVTNFLSKDPFGRKHIDTVRLSDAKCWLIKLQADGKSYSFVLFFCKRICQLTSDYDERNYFNVEKFLDHNLILKPDDKYEVIELVE
jgi:hypothetical protein